MTLLRRGTHPLPPYDPSSPPKTYPSDGTPGVNTDAIGEGDVAGYIPASRPQYIADPTRPVADPFGQSLIGVLSDILAVLLGTYNGKGRPEQLNISPGFRGTTKLNTHVRYHVTRIKGSGAAGSRVDIMVGTEIIEQVYAVTGAPYDIGASFWIDRGQDVSAVDGLTGSTTFSCILIAMEAD